MISRLHIYSARLDIATANARDKESIGGGFRKSVYSFTVLDAGILLGCTGLKDAKKMPHNKSRQTKGKIPDYRDLLLKDHGLVRMLLPNRYKLTDDFWRSGQPSPRDIARFAQSGIRTVVNLRNEQDRGWYRLERDACEAHGLTLVNAPVRARGAPSVDGILGFEKLFRKIEYPAVVHCKSGSDRSGFVSALYLHFVHGVPLEEAAKQLGIKYGHFKSGKAGILDHLFYLYRTENDASPISFPEWLRTKYDQGTLKESKNAVSLWEVIRRYYLN